MFKPINEGHIGLYVCGPTVYSNVHLGNVRTFMSFDMIFRYFKHLGYKVRYVRNITDAGHLENDEDQGEDRIAKKARLEQLEPMEVVQMYTVDFHNILNTFNFLPPSIEPTATGHIVEQIEIIKEIIDNGFAYEANGSIYFDVLKRRGSLIMADSLIKQACPCIQSDLEKHLGKVRTKQNAFLSYISFIKSFYR